MACGIYRTAISAVSRNIVVTVVARVDTSCAMLKAMSDRGLLQEDMLLTPNILANE